MKKLMVLTLAFLAFAGTSVHAQRTVLVEQFTNSGCPICAGNTPVVASYINDHLDEVLMLSYHAPFPYNDSMYYENAFQFDQRLAFYSIFGVPTSKVDGNYFSGNLPPVIDNTITNRAETAPRYAISFTSSTITNNMVEVKVHFESLDAANAGEALKGMVVVAEKKVLKSSYAASPGNNSETEYPWVVRHMLPDQNGVTLENTGLSGTDDVTLNWTADNVKDFNEVRVIAFVQNIGTKEIYQSEISTPQLVSGISDVADANASFSIYPSLTSSNFTVALNKLNGKVTVRIMDLAGRILQEQAMNAVNTTLSTNAMPAGVYLVTVEHDDNKTETQRLAVIK